MARVCRVLRFALAVLFMAMGIQVAARATTIPLVLGTSADDVIINFDFSSAANPPPYSGTILSFFHVDASIAPFTVVYDYYGALNGVGLLGTDSTTESTGGSWSIGTGCPSATAYCADVLDGIFSIGLHLTEGAATFSDSPIAPSSLAFDLNSTDPAAAVDGTLVLSSVPEPGTLALVALAFVAMGLSRFQERRERRGQTRLI